MRAGRGTAAAQRGASAGCRPWAEPLLPQGNSSADAGQNVGRVTCCSPGLSARTRCSVSPERVQRRSARASAAPCAAGRTCIVSEGLPLRVQNAEAACIAPLSGKHAAEKCNLLRGFRVIRAKLACCPLWESRTPERLARYHQRDSVGADTSEAPVQLSLQERRAPAWMLRLCARFLGSRSEPLRSLCGALTCLAPARPNASPQSRLLHCPLRVCAEPRAACRSPWNLRNAGHCRGRSILCHAGSKIRQCCTDFAFCQALLCRVLRCDEVAALRHALATPAGSDCLRLKSQRFMCLSVGCRPVDSFSGDTLADDLSLV
jgi:hypothetical protein